MSDPSNNLQTATLGGGCFWCFEALFEKLEGVLDVVSGYAAGQTEAPTYKEVCSGQTGHAEVVQVHFDPGRISYTRILEVFFKVHDPTTLNKQGADTGTQYRSIILHSNDAQLEAAKTAKANAAKLWPDPIVTEIDPLETFYKAEDYHQDYFRNNPNQPYCAAIIAPKVAKLNPSS
mgnify:CR=1 FL=1